MTFECFIAMKHLVKGKRHGFLSLISIISVSYLFCGIIFNLGYFLYSKILILSTVGWRFVWEMPDFDLFFLNVRSFGFLIISLYFLIIFAIILGRRMTKEKTVFSFNMFYFFPVFGIIAPFWLIKAVFNTIVKRRPAWR